MKILDAHNHIDRAPPPHGDAIHRRFGLILVAAGLCLLALLLSGEAAAEDDQTASGPGSSVVEATGVGLAQASTAPPITRRVPLEGQQVSTGQTLLSLDWGDGESQVGLQFPQEGLARGPEGFAVTKEGAIALLDSVNKRLLLFDGNQRPVSICELDLAEPGFVAADEQTVAVADFGGTRLLKFDWQGEPRQELDLPQPNDVITGLFVDGERTLLEVAHEAVFEVKADTADLARRGRGSLDLAPGRPLRPGSRGKVTAEFRKGASPRVELTVGQGLSRAHRVDLDFGRPLDHLVALDAGEAEILIAAKLPAPDAEPGPSRLAVGRIALNEADAGLSAAYGSFAESLVMEVPGFAYVGAPCVFGADGLVYQPLAQPEGYSILVHTTERPVSQGSSA